MLNYRIISFFENLKSSKNNGSGTMEQSEHLAAIHSTLKLWGDSYTHFETERDFVKKIREMSVKRESGIIVLDGLKGSLFEEIERCKGRVESLVITSDDLDYGNATPEALSHVNHYLSLTSGHLATTSLIAAIKKVVSKEIFGAEKYLTYGTPIHVFSLSRSDDRAWFIENLLDYVSGLSGVIPSGATEFARMAGDVLDEFLMNSIWDANPARVSVDRSIPVFLKPDEVVRVEWGVDGNLLAVSVTDPFGTFRRDNLHKYTDEVLGLRKQRQVKINRHGPGAGIGLHMVMRRVSGLVINVAPGVATEFVALFDVTKSSRFLSKGPKTFHFFHV
jgi:hypothetical protein